MMQQPIDWPHFTNMIASASTVLLTVHQRPDGDCLGSEIAMYRALTGLGKEVRAVNPHKTPPTLAFLDPMGMLRALDDLSEEERDWIYRVDLILVLDTSSWAQLGNMGPVFRESKAKKMVLDHHHKGDDIGAECFVDSTAEATGVLVVRALDALGVPLTEDVATPAFAALATDTGWFRFKSVGSETYRVAARLVDAGVQPDELYRNLYEQESLGRIRLVGRTLSKTEPHFDGQVMLTWVMVDDLRQAGALASDTEDIVNMTLQVRGTKVAILISELKDGSFKVSFRSRCAVDCSQLASFFSGGGHKAAAGATLTLPFEETKKTILEAVGRALKEI